jgi:hypothetical protein
MRRADDSEGSCSAPALGNAHLCLIARQQIKPPLVNQCTSFRSCRHTKVRRIELAPASLRYRPIELIQKLNVVNMPRGSDPSDNDMFLNALVMFMVNIGIPPTIRAKLLKILRMRIDDSVLVQVDTCTGQLARFNLRAGKIKKLVILPNEGRQVRKDGNFGITVGVMGNGCAVYEDDVAVVDAHVAI